MSETSPLALWNGVVMPLTEVRISPLDRGYLFGDAAYEVLRIYAGKPFLLTEHEARLGRSLGELGITPPAGKLGEKIQKLVNRQGLKNGSVYVQVSRGEGPRSHVPPPGLKPNELLFLQELPEAALKAKNDQGIRVTVMPDERWGRCDIKSTNLLGNCLAAAAARQGGFDEALLHDTMGYVTEGAHTTFFGVLDGALVTPKLSPRILPGITREFVIKLATKLGMPVRLESLHRDHLGRLSEAFLTGTVSEIFPIVRIDDRDVGDGRPGFHTKKLQSDYQAWLPR